LVPPESVGVTSAKLGKIHEVLQRYVDAGKAPGLVVLIAKNGKLIYEDATGKRDVATGAPMEMDTIFQLASMSKPFTSVAILQLYEAGKLKLEDAVAEYVPSLAKMKVHKEGWPKQYERATSEMTIHQLLTHTSGLSYGAISIPDAHVSNLYYDRGVHYNRLVRDCPECSKTLEEMIQRLSGMPLAYDPGSSWEYSIASDVLAYVVEKLSGERFDHYLKRHIFDPLKMVDTRHYVLDKDRSRLATVYEYAEDKIVPTGIAGRYTKEPTYFGGGGELVSTAPDYFRFAQMLLNRGELDGARILRPAAVKLMTSNHLTEIQRAAMVKQIGKSLEGYGFGYGVAVGMNPSEEYGGYPNEFFWGGGAGTKNWIDPVNNVVGIIMNHVRFSQNLAIDADVKKLVRQSSL
jgi:CubicO group peptidase (beta-lactamase class C family)